MNEVPEREEITKAMKELRESAQGEDGVRIGFIRNACEEVKAGVVEMVHRMRECRADRWDESVKLGLWCRYLRRLTRLIGINTEVCVS